MTYVTTTLLLPGVFLIPNEIKPSQTNVVTEMGRDPQKVAQVGNQGRIHSRMERSGCYIGVLKAVFSIRDEISIRYEITKRKRTTDSPSSKLPLYVTMKTEALGRWGTDLLLHLVIGRIYERQ